MIVIVTGSRHYSDAAEVYRRLGSIGPIAMLMEGGASGADHLAREWCRHHDVRCQTVFADWKKHGRAAGPIRNEEMAIRAKAEAGRRGMRAVLVAFPGGRGTANMVSWAEKYGIEVRHA